MQTAREGRGLRMALRRKQLREFGGRDVVFYCAGLLPLSERLGATEGIELRVEVTTEPLVLQLGAADLITVLPWVCMQSGCGVGVRLRGPHDWPEARLLLWALFALSPLTNQASSGAARAGCRHSVTRFQPKTQVATADQGEQIPSPSHIRRPPRTPPTHSQRPNPAISELHTAVPDQSHQLPAQSTQ